MKKYKSKISVIIVVALFIVNMCMITIPAHAVSDPQYAFSGRDATITKASVSVHYSPYSFTPANDTITQGQQIIVIERDNNHYYIEYKKSTETFTRTGYILRSDVSVSGSVPWCNYNIFTPGNIVSSSNVPAHFGPHTSHYMCVTTLPTLLGDKIVNGSVNDSRPLLVLRDYTHPKTNQEFYMVQYVANYTELANTVQPYYIRCWVPKSTVALYEQEGVSYFPSGNYTLIRNVNTLGYGGDGLYLTAVQDSSGNWSVGLREPTGDRNQQWKVVRFNYDGGGVYYKIISKAAPTKCLQLTGSIPQMGTSVILADVTDYPTYYGMPNKGQEFKLDPIVTGQNKEGLSGPDHWHNGYVVGQLYRIRSRASGCYGEISLANGTEVVHSRVAATWVGNWSFERLNKFYDGTYMQLSGSTGTKAFPYYVYPDVSNVGISRDKVIEAISRWNDIYTTEGNLWVETYPVDNPEHASLKVLTADRGTRSEAAFVPRINLTTVSEQENDATYNAFINGYVDDIWDGGEIRLNTNSGSNSFKDIGLNRDGTNSEETNNHPAKLGVVCHEFGHALKLKHPYGEDPEGQNLDLPTQYKAHVVESVMNQGVYTMDDKFILRREASLSKVEYSPTSYDRQTLLNKWKGEVE